MSEDSSSLISQNPSTSGLQIALHPLALLTISDYITRHTLRGLNGPVIGALLGTQSGREIGIEHAYEVLVLSDETTGATIEKEWFEQKLKLFKETHKTQDLVGWFSTTSSPSFAPSPAHVAVHRQLLEHNESLILLLINHSPSASVGGKLPLAIYESIYEADETSVSKALRLKFVPLKHTIETGEAEMIGMDMVAKGAGNATETAPPPPPQKDTKKQQGGKKEEVNKGDAEKEDTKVDVGPQNDELLANLTAKKNAIVMLNGRIKLLLKYLQDPPQPVNQQVLREIKSLTHSRLPLLTPSDSAAFEKEKLAEEADVNLVVLLGTLTKSIEEVRSVGKKFYGIESIKSSKQHSKLFDEGLDGFPGMVSRERERRTRLGFGNY